MNKLQNIDSDMIISIFKRKNKHEMESQITSLFKNFADEVKNQILSEAELLKCEEPTILSFLHFSDWFLITNQRLLWKEENKLSSVLLEDVEEVDIDRQELLKNMFSKRQIHTIKINAKNRKPFFINIGEPGNKLFSILSVLSYIIGKNREKRIKCHEEY